MITNTYDRGRTIEYASHVGFKDGTQNVPAESKLAEYTAAFERMKAEVKKQFTDLFAHLRAESETKRIERHETETMWQTFSAMTNGIPPPIMLFVVGMIVAALIAVVEPFFLAPVMDGLGIPNHLVQLLTAFVLVITPAVLFEAAKYAYRKTADHGNEVSQKKKYLILTGTAALSILVLIYTIILGLWRAKELIHVGKMDPDGAASFLTESSAETTVVFVTLTVALPLALMFLVDYCLSKLSFAYSWRKARGNARKLVAEHEAAEKVLTATEEKQDESLRCLDEQAEEFRQAYLHAHAQGLAIGAWRQPVIVPVVKTVAVFLATLAICFLINLVIDALFGGFGFAGTRLLIIALVTLSVTTYFGGKIFRSWNTPTAAELIEQQATLFKNVRRIPVLAAPVSQNLLPGSARRILPQAVNVNGGT